jgi:hypothetical protein
LYETVHSFVNDVMVRYTFYEAMNSSVRVPKVPRISYETIDSFESHVVV